MRLWSVSGIAGMLVIVLALTSCGERAETPEDRVRATLEALQDDMRAGRLGEVCTALAAKPRRQIGSVGHRRRPTSCPSDLREFARNTKAYAGEREVTLGAAAAPEVLAVAVEPGGAAARATLELGDGDPFSVALVREGGRWKLADFFGVLAPPPRVLR